MVGGGSQSSSNKSQSSSAGTDVWGAQSPYLQDIYRQAQQQYQSSQAQGNGYVNAILGQGNQTLQAMQDPNAGFADQMAMYSKAIGTNFNEVINPQIKSQAMQAGGFGGSRQQIGQGLAAGKVAQQMSDFAGQQWQGNQDRALEAANSALGYADFARSMPWYNVSQYAGLIGAPTMYDKGSKSSSKGSSSGWNASFLGG